MKEEKRRLQLEEKLGKMKRFENPLYDEGIRYIAGVDEVGRGPLAGPVVAAAVVLPVDFNILGVDDSKKLSPKKREEMYEKIIDSSIALGVGCENNEKIDQINILEATKTAMKQALRELEKNLREKLGPNWTEITGSKDRVKPCAIQHILIDAVKLSDMPIPQTAIVGGDQASISIAAASIIAKVTRDRMMVMYSRTFPYYKFENNKGYGTKAHLEGIRANGLCAIHRRTFCKKVWNSP